MADESQQSARSLTRISILLLVLMTVIGGYAYSAHARYDDLCSSIYQQAKASDSVQVRKIGSEIISAHCR